MLYMISWLLVQARTRLVIPNSVSAETEQQRAAWITSRWIPAVLISRTISSLALLLIVYSASTSVQPNAIYISRTSISRIRFLIYKNFE